jgi:hypothetical protein
MLSSSDLTRSVRNTITYLLSRIASVCIRLHNHMILYHECGAVAISEARSRSCLTLLRKNLSCVQYLPFRWEIINMLILYLPQCAASNISIGPKNVPSRTYDSCVCNSKQGVKACRSLCPSAQFSRLCILK